MVNASIPILLTKIDQITSGHFHGIFVIKQITFKNKQQIITTGYDIQKSFNIGLFSFDKSQSIC